MLMWNQKEKLAKLLTTATEYFKLTNRYAEPNADIPKKEAEVAELLNGMSIGVANKMKLAGIFELLGGMESLKSLVRFGDDTPLLFVIGCMVYAIDNDNEHSYPFNVPLICRHPSSNFIYRAGDGAFTAGNSLTTNFAMVKPCTTEMIQELMDAVVTDEAINSILSNLNLIDFISVQAGDVGDGMTVRRPLGSIVATGRTVFEYYDEAACRYEYYVLGSGDVFSANLVVPIDVSRGMQRVARDAVITKLFGGVKARTATLDELTTDYAMRVKVGQR